MMTQEEFLVMVAVPGSGGWIRYGSYFRLKLSSSRFNNDVQCYKAKNLALIILLNTQQVLELT
jgi:hypothetical protein